MVDLLIMDHLRVLKDENARSRLRLVSGVPLSVERRETVISGRADWCLGYGDVDGNGGFDATLVVLCAQFSC